jgi:TCP-1/cpn60 chaperonin family
MRVINPATAENVDLNDIRIVKKVGGTIDDTELVEGLVLNQGVIKNAGGPTRMEKAKIGLIQFQLSPPKPDVLPSPPYPLFPYIPSALACLHSSRPTTKLTTDGEPNSRQRLPTNGQDSQGRENLFIEHV